MPRKRPPWMHEADLADKARAEADKLAKKARGSRVFAVLPWRQDARYDGADVIRWFRTRAPAEKFAEGLGDGGGRGVVVRDWTLIRNVDAASTATEKTTAQLEREIREAAGGYGYGS